MQGYIHHPGHMQILIGLPTPAHSPLSRFRTSLQYPTGLMLIPSTFFFCAAARRVPSSRLILVACGKSRFLIELVLDTTACSIANADHISCAKQSIDTLLG